MFFKCFYLLDLKILKFYLQECGKHRWTGHTVVQSHFQGIYNAYFLKHLYLHLHLHSHLHLQFSISEPVAYLVGKPFKNRGVPRPPDYSQILKWQKGFMSELLTNSARKICMILNVAQES